MRQAVIEQAHDPRLARQLGCTIDVVREERTRVLLTIQRGLKEKGRKVPDDLSDFAEYLYAQLRKVERG